jgi:hypothetical protein
MYERHRWPDRTYPQPSRQEEGYTVSLSVREMLGNCRRYRVFCRPLQTPASSGLVTIVVYADLNQGYMDQRTLRGTGKPGVVRSIAIAPLYRVSSLLWYRILRRRWKCTCCGYEPTRQRLLYSGPTGLGLGERSPLAYLRTKAETMGETDTCMRRWLDSLMQLAAIPCQGA